jgi:hypothetical protein
MMIIIACNDRLYMIVCVQQAGQQQQSSVVELDIHIRPYICALSN